MIICLEAVGTQAMESQGCFSRSSSLQPFFTPSFNVGLKITKFSRCEYWIACISTYCTRTSRLLEESYLWHLYYHIWRYVCPEAGGNGHPACSWHPTVTPFVDTLNIQACSWTDFHSISNNCTAQELLLVSWTLSGAWGNAGRAISKQHHAPGAKCAHAQTCILCPPVHLALSYEPTPFHSPPQPVFPNNCWVEHTTCAFLSWTLPVLCLLTGDNPNWVSPPATAAWGSSQLVVLGDQGEENQGHLPHPELL